MANHARIEEVSDSDEDVLDPEEGDIMDLATFTSSNTFKGPRVTPPNQNQTLMNPSNIPSQAQRAPPPQPQFDPAKSKNWHCIYPIYFDASKTRDEGRRVGKKGAVKNPLARTILEAVARLGLNVVFEPQKIHPKDWANPGRVRVELKDENGRIKRPNVKNSEYLLSSNQNGHQTNRNL
jgi:signal recognition particle subunit SRP19